MLIIELLKKMSKNSHTKSYTENKLVNMSKSGKSAYFHYIFVNNFFYANFFAIFSKVLKSA
jgi:hypothetical protein